MMPSIGLIFGKRSNTCYSAPK